MEDWIPLEKSTTYSLIDIYRRFGGTICRKWCVPVKRGPVLTKEYRAISLEDSNLYSQRRDNSKSFTDLHSLSHSTAQQCLGQSLSRNFHSSWTLFTLRETKSKVRTRLDGAAHQPAFLNIYSYFHYYISWSRTRLVHYPASNSHVFRVYVTHGHTGTSHVCLLYVTLISCINPRVTTHYSRLLLHSAFLHFCSLYL
jgi:hypothetical protein